MFKKLVGSASEDETASQMQMPPIFSKINYCESQLVQLALKAQQENKKADVMGFLATTQSSLQKDPSAVLASSKLKRRWIVLFQNLLFVYNSYEEASNIGTSSRCNGLVGVWLLENCQCDKLLFGNTTPTKHILSITFAVSVLILVADNDDQCQQWKDAIGECDYWQNHNNYQLFKERHELALHIIETERIAKWNYVVQMDEALDEVKRLRKALAEARNELRRTGHGHRDTEMESSSSSASPSLSAASEELEHIRKAQSLMRGWLCRHRWKNIIEEYVRSPHAEKMKRRNRVILRMLADEREYVENLNLLISSFLRPLRVVASSNYNDKNQSSQHQGGKVVISHEEINAIFLNSQTLLFLHQIFLQGLTSAVERWPQLLVGDVFQLLMPALNVYTEYVRNHYISVQTLADLKLTRPGLASHIRNLEQKLEACGDSRSLDVLLTTPMNQIPRYILNFHELLAYTPHFHVERPKLQQALEQLEDLSLQMSMEMSESEHIRKNLAIERMIGGGGEVLFDPDQVLIRQGVLLEVGNSAVPATVAEKINSQQSSTPNSYLASIVNTLLSSSSSHHQNKGSSNNDASPRTVFLFSHYLIITTRSSGGKLCLVKVCFNRMVTFQKGFV